MISDILYKSNIFNSLFTEKDFNFLKQKNSEEQNIESKLEIYNKKREEIVNYINKLSDSYGSFKDTESIQEFKTKVDYAQESFEAVNKIIKNLYFINEQFQIIEKEILELILQKENNNDFENSNLKLDNIKQKINEFEFTSNKLQEDNAQNNLIIDKFLATINEVSTNESSKNTTDNSNVDSYSLDNDIKDNLVLLVSEKEHKVYLPYTKSEIMALLKRYPDEFTSAKDVIEQEYIEDISLYNRHPVLARFRESYSLIRDREMKSVVDAFKFAVDIMFRYDLNPAIIAACKTQKQLESYIDCLDSNKLDDFKYFQIIFNVNPI